MKRREILKYTSLITGTALSTPLVSAILSGCSDQKTGSEDISTAFFSPPDLSTVKEIIDVILPKTDSPSASEVGVHRIIDNMVGKVYNEVERENYRSGHTALMKYLNDVSNGNFSELDEAQKNKILREINSTDTTSEVQKAFLELKQQAVAFYLTTEEVAKKHLNYLPVPGEYQACISLGDTQNKAWAL